MTTQNQIEVCQRMMDYKPDGSPRYHAQVKGSTGIWGCGDTPVQAIGDLILSHPERFGVVVEHLPTAQFR